MATNPEEETERWSAVSQSENGGDANKSLEMHITGASYTGSTLLRESCGVESRSGLKAKWASPSTKTKTRIGQILVALTFFLRQYTPTRPERSAGPIEDASCYDNINVNGYRNRIQRRKSQPGTKSIMEALAKPEPLKQDISSYTSFSMKARISNGYEAKKAPKSIHQGSERGRVQEYHC